MPSALDMAMRRHTRVEVAWRDLVPSEQCEWGADACVRRLGKQLAVVDQRRRHLDELQDEAQGAGMQMLVNSLYTQLEGAQTALATTVRELGQYTVLAPHANVSVEGVGLLDIWQLSACTLGRPYVCTTVNVTHEPEDGLDTAALLAVAQCVVAPRSVVSVHVGGPESQSNKKK